MVTDSHHRWPFHQFEHVVKTAAATAIHLKTTTPAFLLTLMMELTVHRT